LRRECTPPDEGFKIRCPKLGHQITFSYCRSENRGLPCFKTLDCWFDHFLVEAYLRQEIGSEKFEEIFNTPHKQKMASLLELIEQAKKTKNEQK
jgi:hypothetical protein